MSGKRRKARIAALQALFELDSVGHQPEQTIARQFGRFPPSTEVKEFAQELVKGVLAHKEQIDKTIENTAPPFRLISCPSLTVIYSGLRYMKSSSIIGCQCEPRSMRPWNWPRISAARNPRGSSTQYWAPLVCLPRVKGQGGTRWPRSSSEYER